MGDLTHLVHTGAVMQGVLLDPLLEPLLADGPVHPVGVLRPDVCRLHLAEDPSPLLLADLGDA